MRDRLSTTPSPTLERASRRLEIRLIEGGARDRDVDVFVAIGAELGRRMACRNAPPASLDAVLDPRD